MKLRTWLITSVVLITILNSVSWSATLSLSNFNFYKPDEEKVTGSALEKAYQLQLEYWKAKTSYDTVNAQIDKILKDKDEQITRDFWIQIALICSLAYTATKN